MEGILAENITFSYPDGYTAVEDVSLHISAGESVAIVGQNGAGKTTMVKMFNALLRPASGRILIDGKDIAGMSTAAVSKFVGYVFQNPGDQIFNNTVYNEIAYILRYNKCDAETLDSLVRDAAELCGISEYLSMNPYDLPFSLRKFVTIAVVIAMGSKYIILDEPTAGQDLDGLHRQRDIIQELVGRGKTIITITHDMRFVIENFQRVIAMADKRIVADAPREELFWDFDVLEKCSLKQPRIADLARNLGFPGRIISKKDFLDHATEGEKAEFCSNQRTQ
ncbi:hypothetical protein B4O97_12035 [Marispirochaeta aestuarii]|uniref:ABC transporter domain-containing protein n=1 Tax=Marispirochaeta aestuarii TaxID=1963862 RepID=A0A1Y1RXY1_9SPIO|nr:ABC transporter ATP-binding protein [Marispirochaeta aestuarii]ORC34670.1 hypothetical protein B4O97_12035 [Marispirochaeta aestuarii]